MVSKIILESCIIYRHIALMIDLVFSLMKDYTRRPNYNLLLELNFIREHATKDTNVAEFVGEILDLLEDEQSV